MITKLFNTYRLLLPALLILPLVLVACGGDDGGDSSDVLPTRVVVGDAEATENQPVDDNETEEPLATEEPVVETAEPEETAMADAPPSGDATPTPETDTNAPPPPPPPPGSDPEQQQSNDDTNDTSAVGPPGTDSEQPTTNSGPPGINNVVTDFSTLTVGASTLLSGVVSVLGDGVEAMPIITDANGVFVEMQSPISIAEAFQEGTVEVFGEIVEASGTTDAQLAIIPSAFSGDDSLAGPGELSNDEPVDSDTNNPPPFVTELDGEVLEFTVDGEATALETYDAVVAELGDTLDGLLWTRISGSSVNGWTIEFTDLDTLTVQTYVVDLEGVVRTTTPVPAPPTVNEETTGIDRDLVVVDSDYVEAQAVDGQDNPFGPPSILLSVNAEGDIVWTIIGPETIAFDATTAPE